MDRERINRLIADYICLYPSSQIEQSDIAGIEARLNVIIPDDMKLISTVYGGDDVGGIMVNAFVPSAPFYNVGDKTLELRNGIGLPNKFLVLAEPAESLIVMETQDDETLPTRVIWLAAYDFERLMQGEPLLNYDEYNSFTDFFEFLLAREHDERES